MATFLFDKVIFGPVFSRRLGISLGINLLPLHKKICNFNCIYCECGLTHSVTERSNNMPEMPDIIAQLETKLHFLKQNNKPLQAITFAGNGEPTLHKHFSEIIDKTIQLRNEYFPEVKIAVLSNATLMHNSQVFSALTKVDLCILKLDSAIENTIKLINCPAGNYSLNQTINGFLKFNGNFILQTMFFTGLVNNVIIDNTTEIELNAWYHVIEQTSPKQIMIYTIARDTPVKNLEKVSLQKLEYIAAVLRQKNYNVHISE